MNKRAARKDLYQPIMHRIEILRIFPRKAQQSAGFIDQHQMLILIEDLYRVMARRGNKGIEKGRHRVVRMTSGSG
ncbi:hypothetical protein D3C72_2332990 [compost metagenome]